MNFVYMDITILVISIILAGMILIFFLLKATKSCLHVDADKAFFVIDIVKAIEEICPLSSVNKWQLLFLNNGAHRCWMQSFYFSALKEDIYLYGSTAVVACSSSHAFSLIADIDSWAEWNPLQVSKLHVKPFQDQHLKRDDYMKADQVVGIQRGTEIQSFTAMYRFLNISDDKGAWILMWNVKKLEFLFFMMQPIVNISKSSQCLVTHILGTGLKNSSHFMSLVAQRMRNIEDFISLSLLNVKPLSFTSSFQTMPKAGCFRESRLKNNHPENVLSFFNMQANERHNNALLQLVPFSYYSYCTLKNLKGFHLTVKKINNQKTKATFLKKVKKKEGASVSSDNSKVAYALRRTVSDLYIRPNNFTNINSNLDISCSNLKKGTDIDIKALKEKSHQVFQETSSLGEKEIGEHNTKLTKSNGNGNDSLSYNHKQSMPQIFTSESDKSRTLTELTTAEILDFKGNCDGPQKTTNSVSEENLFVGNKNKHCFVNQNDFSSSTSDFEIIESNVDLSDCRIAYFVTQGNYGASELQAEVLLASQVLKNLNISDIHEAGGWMYHSNYKGILVFSKNTASRFMKISSFLCQTEIPLSSKDVWKFVKNPRFRFMCDETVKSVKIIDKISNFQKLLHIYHEIGGILKKEMIDFCLLHTERQELNRYYSAFHSVESENCPFMNSVTRGILRPSGWIVEEIEKSKTSKVTYMIQILNSPDSLYYQDLCSLVPQSLINLKHYATSQPA